MGINDIPTAQVMPNAMVAVSTLPRPRPVVTPEVSSGQIVIENMQNIEQIVSHLQDLASSFNRKLVFAVDKRTNRILVKVIDKNTDKVVRELPPDEIVDMVARLKEYVGAIFDKVA
ncbi:MAG: flagellar protein FlaG [bacterium]|jgi:flagellar protein FlaG|nr:flagellar protein FlaG [bacterium]